MGVAKARWSSSRRRWQRRWPTPTARLRDAFVFVTLIAFLAQGFLAQTHIHGITQKTLTAISATDDTTAKQRTMGKFPVLPDEQTCPLCRLAAFVGACVVPLAAVILAFVVSDFLPLLASAVRTPINIASHSWQVRAPPR